MWDGTVNPYRSYSSAEQLAEKEPRQYRRGYRLLIRDTDEELPDMVGRLTQLSQGTL